MLDEMRDTVPLVMRGEGVDMAEATKEDWLAAIDKIGEAVDSGQIRALHRQRLHRGPDQRQRRRLDRLVRRRLPDRQTTTSSGGGPTEGCDLWFDMMTIPVGAPNTAAALEFINFAYEPEVQADIAEFVNYVTPVEGVKEILAKQDPALAKNDADLPQPRSSSRTASPSRSPREATRTWPEVDRGLAGGHLRAEITPARTKRCDRAVSAMNLRRRLLPYGLLGPGAIWLDPLLRHPHVLHGRAGPALGHLHEGFNFSWELSNFPDSLDGRGEQIGPHLLSTPARPPCSALLIAYPLAYAIAIKASPRWRLLLLFAVIAPFFTTYLIRTIAWKTILADSSPIVDVLQTVGSARRRRAPAGDLDGAVIAGLTYNFLPFMILPIYASLERIDLSLIEAAKDLYASSRQAFLKVTLPLTAPGIVAGVLLTFIPAFGDYVNAQILGSPNRR